MIKIILILLALFFSGCLNKHGISAKYYSDCKEYYDFQGYYHYECGEDDIITYEEIGNSAERTYKSAKKTFNSVIDTITFSDPEPEPEPKPKPNVW
ncbi:hypothetical protein [Sulfurimonas sp.]